MLHYIILKHCQPSLPPSGEYDVSPAAPGAFPKGLRAGPLNTVATGGRTPASLTLREGGSLTVINAS